MLHEKFHYPVLEKIFKGFYHTIIGVAAIFIIFLFPLPKESPHEI